MTTIALKENSVAFCSILESNPYFIILDLSPLYAVKAGSYNPNPWLQALTWKSIVSVLLLRLLRHSIFMRPSRLSSSARGTGSLDILVVMMAASQGRMGDPAIRNRVTTWTCMKSAANRVMAVAWTTYTKHSLIGMK